MPSPSDPDRGDVTGQGETGAAGAADGSSRDWRDPPGLRPDWSLGDVGRATVPLLVGTLVVWIPYVVLAMWATRALVDLVEGLEPVVALALVVFLSLTTFSSFLFSAVMLVDRLLPWESPLAME